MIVDKLQALDRYVSLNPLFAKAVAAIEWLVDAEDGRYEIDGDRVFATVGMSDMRALSKAPLEAHDRYIDIQIVLQGVETYGWKNRCDCSVVTQPMDTEKDIVFYGDKPAGYITLSGGDMVVFFPEDGHAPLIGEGQVRKCIIKVAAER